MKIMSMLTRFFVITGCVIFLLMSRLFTDPEIRWKEEVKLHDGRVIVVDRWAKRQWMGELGHRGLPLWSEIKTKNPNTGAEINWYEDAGSDAYVFDFIGDTAYLAVRISFYQPCKKYDFPKRDFVFFKFDGIWKKISIEEFPATFDTNLLFNVWTAASANQMDDNLITIEKKSDYIRSGWSLNQYSMRNVLETPKFARAACDEFAESTKQ